MKNYKQKDLAEIKHKYEIKVLSDMSDPDFKNW